MSYRYFQNRDCEFFPCHSSDGEDFNCLFCYCPLYALGDRCGGNYRYLENGIKDCSACLLPHKAHSYDYICQRFSDIAELCRKKEK